MNIRIGQLGTPAVSAPERLEQLRGPSAPTTLTPTELLASLSEPSLATRQLLDSAGTPAPTTSYDGAQGGVLDLLQQSQALGPTTLATPFNQTEIQQLLTLLQAQSQTPALDQTQAQNGLARLGENVRAAESGGTDATDAMSQYEQLLQLLVQLMLALGMSAQSIDELLAGALGDSGGWTGPSGGAQPMNVPGRPARQTPRGMRWSDQQSGGSTQERVNTPYQPVKDPAPAGFGVSAGELKKIVPGLSESRAAEITPHLNAAMHEAGITSKREQAAFIAQLSHESGGFKYFEELASGKAYEGRGDLGNNQPGDGQRFKGRGPIQLTGRSNYRAAGKALGLDLEKNPELAARTDVGFRVSAWYWKSRGISGPAQQGDFNRVTKLINGGYNGLASRQQYYQRALSELSA